MGVAKDYWVHVEGRGFFVRFVSHAPQPRWSYSSRVSEAYCFASVEDADRVVAQLQSYGRSAKVVTRKPEPARAASGESHRTVELSPLRLRPWVARILESSGDGDLKGGYRTLARQHHPDVGGRTESMQLLSEAYSWLRTHTRKQATDRGPSASKGGPKASGTPESASVWDDMSDDDIPF